MANNNTHNHWTHAHQTQEHWDIFCTVVDNYGDIGVTWRLAKQLAREYLIAVNLWVDDLNSFSHILPTLNPNQAIQHFDGVTIKLWDKPLSLQYHPGSVLIEAFACELPTEVIDKITQYHHSTALTAPLWLNLEYLSAEDWVDGCHALPSLQASGLKKYFYFPGFNEKTGGLICERDLFAERESWQSDPSNRDGLFQQLGLKGIGVADTVISIFSYETEALASLCQLWQSATTKVHALIPIGRSLNSLGSIITHPGQVSPGQQFTYGNLTIHILPMTDQLGFDRLLWSCDFNIVRGEDSFLRAQWAAKPFIWHIYPQEEDYHLIKLRAFMALYCHNLAPEIADSWQALNLAFNEASENDIKQYWQKLELANLPLMHHAQKWPIDALNDTDLASRLVQFVKNS
ncbi:elongation factor P maturation arginine rhamnosyltransferase EarP [Shewanella psychrotolerans]|uniref:elongation factor P maturation arginine rhamnosyltransferase EarP n=1 Tax=Shewanella psychrotolerans TaxID=2864206 RepID=UPI001C65BE5C|nr:elongation factor P maturation arginine rhamnosyltransferase EarP [Shewanella psychrotolerans]QYJ99825.1 elongation factor P maturation arginine rhamnosyltransferase EarP [Shewanella psychrotolerans]